jgi:hypothetical protein
VTTPASAAAASKASGVQLAGVPLPTTVVGRETSSGAPSGGMAQRRAGLPGGTGAPGVTATPPGGLAAPPQATAARSTAARIDEAGAERGTAPFFTPAGCRKGAARASPSFGEGLEGDTPRNPW